MKFKIGDKVKLIKITSCTSGFRLGDICEVLDINVKGRHQIKIMKNNGCTGYVDEEHIELINKQFTKSDLKDGDIVTYRNGDKRYVDATNKKIVYIDDHHCLSFRFDNFIEDLTDKARDTEYDIIKVERPTGYETVFERKEEILDEVEKRYLRDVIRPFSKDIEIIRKITAGEKEYLMIIFKDGDSMSFKNFKKGAMYKNMEAAKKYTLEELEL